MSRMTSKPMVNHTGNMQQQQDNIDFISSIDPSKIKIPSLGILSARARSNFSLNFQGDVLGCHSSDSCSFNISNQNVQQHREDVTIEIHKSEALPHASLTVPGWIVPVCVIFFGIILALSNLLQPSFTGSVCLSVSPSGIIAISAHAFASSASLFVAVGLFSSAWFLPLVCSERPLGQAYFVFLQIYVLWLSLWVFFSLRVGERIVALLPFISLILTGVVSFFSVFYTERNDPRWSITLSCFLCFILCVYATRNSFRYNYTIKPLL